MVTLAAGILRAAAGSGIGAPRPIVVGTAEILADVVRGVAQRRARGRNRPAVKSREEIGTVSPGKRPDSAHHGAVAEYSVNRGRAGIDRAEYYARCRSQ